VKQGVILNAGTRPARAAGLSPQPIHRLCSPSDELPSGHRHPQFIASRWQGLAAAQILSVYKKLFKGEGVEEDVAQA
jgi:hypothetical protein